MTDQSIEKKRFARYYVLENGNASAAYRKIHPDCSDSAAHQGGAVLARDSEVQGYIELVEQEDADRHQAMRDRVIQTLERMAFTEVPGIVHLKGGVITHEDWENLSPEQRWCIQSAKQREDGCIEVKLYDRIKCLELLGKHVGMFSDKQVENVAPVVWNINLDGKRETEQ